MTGIDVKHRIKWAVSYGACDDGSDPNQTPPTSKIYTYEKDDRPNGNSNDLFGPANIAFHGIHLRINLPVA